MVTLALAVVCLIGLGREAWAAFEQPDEPLPVVCPNGAELPPGTDPPDGCVSWNDSWLGNLVISPSVVGEGDILTLEWTPYYGQRTGQPSDADLPASASAAGWSGFYSFVSNLRPHNCEAYSPTCALRVVQGPVAPRPEADGSTDPVSWLRANVGLANGIGPASEQRPYYIRPSVFWAQFRLHDEDGTPLQISSGIRAYIIRLERDGVVYDGDIFSDLNRRFQIYQFRSDLKFDEFRALNPQYATDLITTELAGGPARIPVAETRIEQGNALDNIITAALWRGVHDIFIIDNAGRLFEPFSVDVIDDNLDIMVQASPDPLVVTDVRAPTAVDPLAPFDIEVDISNVSDSTVTNVRPTVARTVLPANAGGVSVSTSSPFSEDLAAGQSQTYVVTLTPQQGGRVALDVRAIGTIGLTNAPVPSITVRSDAVRREVRLGGAELIANFRLSALDSVLGDVYTDSTADGIVSVVQVIPGEEITADLVAFNNGDVDVTGVHPVGIFPDRGVRVVSGPTPAGPENLAPGTGATFTYKITADSAGTFAFRGTVSGQSDSGTETADANGRVEVAGMSLRVVDAPNDIDLNDLATITVEVSSDDTPLRDITVSKPTVVTGDGQILSLTDDYTGLHLDPFQSMLLDFDVYRSEAGDVTWEIQASAFANDEYVDPDGNFFDPYFFDISASVRGDFGGGILEVVSLAVDPAEPLVGEAFDLVAEVSNSSSSTVTGIQLDVVELLNDLVRPGTGTVDPIDLAPDTSGTLRMPFVAEATGTTTLSAEAFGTSDTGEARSDPQEIEVTLGEPALQIELRGRRRLEPGDFDIVATITNLLDEPVMNVNWTGGGLSVEELDGADVVTQTSGPSPLLPTQLSANGAVEVVWEFSIDTAGDVVFKLQGIGETDAGAPAKGNAALSAEIGNREFGDIDVDRLLADGLEETFTALHDLTEQFSQENATEIALTANEQFVKERYDIYRRQGFGDWSSRALASLDLNQASFESYWSNFGQSFQSAIDARGQQGGDAMYRVWDTVSDPLKRRQFSEAAAKSAKENLGYVGDAFALPVDQKIQNIIQGNTALVNSTRQTANEVWTGQREIWRLEAEQYATDRVGFWGTAGGRHGGYGGNATFDTMVGVATEPLAAASTAGAIAVARTGNDVVGNGLRALRNGRRSAEVIEETGDATATAARRMAVGEAEVRSFQQLEYGAVVDESALIAGGFAPDDAATIQTILSDARAMFGVDLQMVARTADPNSISIPGGLGKQEWMKYKATSELDKMLGAPPEASGVVTVFEPRRVSQQVLDAIEVDNPGFSKAYMERLNTQTKNWNEWQAGSGRVKRLVDASAASGDQGITVINARPGRPTYGVDYIEQLNDPQFVADRGLTPAQVSELRAHPSQTQVNVVAVEIDGGISFYNKVGDDLKPWVSDYDLQGVRPVDGDWPPGRRGQIETWVKNRFDRELSRSGRHGWSDSAFDLPSDYYELAAEYQLSTAHPDVAQALAGRIEGRFQRLAAQADREADLLQVRIDAGDPNAATLAVEVGRLRDKATNWRQLTADELLDRYPPGEKTIVFTAGDIRVGSGTAP